jgi:hypothetical protein
MSLNFQALAMVEEETRRYRPTKNYLEHLPPLNLSAFEVSKIHIQADLQRMRDIALLHYVMGPLPNFH